VEQDKSVGESPFATKTLDEIREPASLDSISKCIEFVKHNARQLGYSEERIKEMEQAFTEVLTNIVTYAYKDKSGDIQISYTLDRTDRMVFKIIDWGKSFNMLLTSDPLFKEEFLEQGTPQPSTRFVKKLTDTVEYQHLDDKNYLVATFSPAIKDRKQPA
jgi:anti-sigma regulatory factor (Ser/Thr protein kinase)